MQIIKAELKHVEALCALAITTFKESHGHSAPAKDIDAYIQKNYTTDQFTKELLARNSEYYVCVNEGNLVGYSKIIFNCSTATVSANNIAKLERIYVLESEHGKQLGLGLLNFNVQLAKQHQQAGIWLYTWIENKKAIRFYEQYGFRQIGHHDFSISKNHSNPNWQYYLSLQ